MTPRLWMVIVANIGLGGCAHSYIDENGDMHVTGLVQMVIPGAANAEIIGGESVRLRALGMSFLSGQQHASVTLGYSDQTTVLLRNNSCVAIGPKIRSLQ